MPRQVFTIVSSLRSCWSIHHVSIDGFQYVLSFTNDFSGQVMTYFLKQKSNSVEATKRFFSECAPFGKIRRLTSDTGTEFTSKEFQALMMENKIHHESQSHIPHTKIVPRRETGELYLRWTDVCCLKQNYRKICRHMPLCQQLTLGTDAIIAD